MTNCKFSVKVDESCKKHYDIETKQKKIKHWITASIIGVQKAKLSMSSSL